MVPAGQAGKGDNMESRAASQKANNSLIIKRSVSVAVIVFGLIFGGTWNKTGFCLGDSILSALGLKSWVQETSGLHYSALIGTILILLGVGVFNTTLSRKARYWVWGTVIFLLVAGNIALSFV